MEKQAQDAAKDNTKIVDMEKRNAELRAEEECERQGGEWGGLGFRGNVCNLPTKDAGKICTDSSQCESSCFAKDINSTSGTCGNTQQFVGCGYITMENGGAGRLPCAD